MKISEFIEQLEKVKKGNGDLEMCHILDVIDSVNDYPSDINGDTVCVTQFYPKPIYLQFETKQFYNFQYAEDVEGDEDFDLDGYTKMCTI